MASVSFENRETPSISPLEVLLHDRLASSNSSAFEKRICHQFLQLPQTLAALQENKENESSLFDQSLRHAKLDRKSWNNSRAIEFYRSLVVELYKDDGMRENFLREMYEVMHRRSDELLQGDRLERKVAIVGGGGSGLTVARELIDKGMDPQEVIVLEATDRIGGVFAVEVSEFELINPITICGDAVLVQPKDIFITPKFKGIFRPKVPTNREYAHAVLIDAYFDGVEVAFRTKSDMLQGTSMVIHGDHTTIPVTVKGNQQKEVVADVTVLAQTGIGYPTYGSINQEIKKAKEQPYGEYIFNAGDFMEYLATLEKRFLRGDIARAADQLTTMLTQGLAIVGVGKSTVLFVDTIASMVNNLYKSKYWKQFAERMKVGRIFVYDPDNNRELAMRDIMRKYPDIRHILQEFFNYDRAKLRAEVIGVEKGSKNNLTVVGMSVFDDARTELSVGMIAFTGYSSEGFWEYIAGIRDGDGNQLFSEQRNYIDFDIYHHDSQRKIYVTWPTKDTFALQGGKQNPNSRGDINRDSDVAVKIGRDIYYQLFPTKRSRRLRLS